MRGEFLCASKYFTARRIRVSSGERQMLADEKSFQCIICISGEGRVGGFDAKAGESFFVPADYGTYTLMGNMEIILAEIRKYYVGIDVNGGIVSACLTDDAGRFIAKSSRGIKLDTSAESIAEMCRELLHSLNMTFDDICDIVIDVAAEDSWSLHATVKEIREKLLCERW